MPHLILLADSSSTPWGAIIAAVGTVCTGAIFIGGVLLRLSWVVRGATDELKSAAKSVGDLAPRVAVLERDKIERDAVERDRASGTRKRNGTSPGDTRKLAAVQSIQDDE